jgi:hypothetical protein
MSVQSLKTEEIVGTNGISPALLLGEHNSFSDTPLLGSSIAILKKIFAYISFFLFTLKSSFDTEWRFVQQDIFVRASAHLYDMGLLEWIFLGSSREMPLEPLQLLALARRDCTFLHTSFI